MVAPIDNVPGDGLLAGANMIFERAAIIPAGPDEVWPWLVQLGKRRAGWYLPAGVERLLPPARRAVRTIDSRWQNLSVGDRVPDYGGPEEYLEVVRIEAGRALVYRSERRGAEFTWALLLDPQPPGQTRLRLRFRGRLASTGWRRRAIVAAGDFLDWSTSELMLRGLRERVAGAAA